MNEEIHVYCMPGMAANSKIFEHIRLPKPYVIHLLDWKIGKKATPSPGLLKKGILFPFFLEALANYSPKKSLSIFGFKLNGKDHSI